MLLNLLRELSLRPIASPRGWDAPTAVRAALAALSIFVLVLGANLMTPLFPVLQERMMLSNTAVTAGFVAYILPVILGFLLLGHWSEYMGRRIVLVGGLSLGVVGTTVLLTASALPQLLMGRGLLGLAVALGTGAGAAALRDILPDHPSWCARIALLANVGGCGVGPLAGGLLSELGDPIRVPLTVHLLLVMALIVPLMVLRANPPTLTPPPNGRIRVLRPSRPALSAYVRTVFFLASSVGFLSFAVFGFFLSLAPIFYVPLLGESRVMAAVPALLLFGSSGAAQLGSVQGRHKGTVGLGGMAAGLALLVVAEVQQQWWMLLGAVIVVGIGQGVAFRTLFSALNSQLPQKAAARTISLMYSITYLGSALPVLGLGVAMDRWGLLTSVNTYMLAIAGFTLVLAFACWMYRPATPGTSQEDSTL